jgi:hypothetical protein
VRAWLKLIEQVILALWAGTLVGVGALVPPVIFQHLADRHSAGVLVGVVLRQTTVLSLMVATVLAAWALFRVAKSARLSAIGNRLVPAGLLALSQWGVRPVLEVARVASGADSEPFRAWHAVSTGLYALATLWVLGLLVSALRR